MWPKTIFLVPHDLLDGPRYLLQTSTQNVGIMAAKANYIPGWIPTTRDHCDKNSIATPP